MGPINLVIALLIITLIAGVLAQTDDEDDDYRTCYRIDGGVLPDAVRCTNSTMNHSACCSTGEICWSNGVCATAQGTKDYLREGCTDWSWKDPACFDVCPWYVGDIAIGVRPCGGIDKSNSYCCDDGSNGIGSFACCNDESNVFKYDNITTLPTIIATIPSNDISTPAVEPVIPPTSAVSIDNEISTGSLTTKTTSTRSISIQSVGPSAVPTESRNSSTNTSISTGLGAGLGVGLPVAAAIIAGIWFVIWRSRRKHNMQMEHEKGLHEGLPSNLMIPGNGTPKPPTPPSSLGLYNNTTNTRGIAAHELASSYHGRELPA
ncbi:hypothetical protein F5Y11DRAFT_346217 [Daldinia sp. FL1419]|nr:hypothetical protein F5Y11DRAFT_346217 [Daldinia sp. FL1419]